MVWALKPKGYAFRVDCFRPDALGDVLQAKPVVDAGGIFNYARSQGMIKQKATA